MPITPRSEIACGMAGIKQEVDVPLTWSGAPPQWLVGDYVHNGPGRFTAGGRQVSHVFDGLGMLNRIRFAAGGATYRNRFLRGRSWQHAEQGRPDRGFSFDPPRSLLTKLSILVTKDPEVTDNCLVNTVEYAGRQVALTETAWHLAYDDELNTTGHFRFSDDLWPGMTPAHPVRDPASGEYLNVVFKLKPPNGYQVWSLAPGTDRRRLVAMVPVRHPSYLHAIAATPTRIVIPAWPLVGTPLHFALRDRPFIHNFRWEPQRGTLFHVVDRASGAIRTVQGPPWFAFHPVNAFDRGGEIVLDCCVYRDPSIIKHLSLSRMISGNGLPAGQLRRFVLDAQHDRFDEEAIPGLACEFPRLDERAMMRSHRLLYAIGEAPADRTPLPCRLRKLDLISGQVRDWQQSGAYPNEPIFVPRPGGSAEDDGVVLSIVLDAQRRRSFLLILDAARWTECARADLPHALPLLFHGRFSPPGPPR